MAGTRWSLPRPNGSPRSGQLNGESPRDVPRGPEREREAPRDEPPNGHVLPRLLPGLLPSAPFMPPGDLVVVDVETTGWLTDAASITEIGAVRLSPGEPRAEFSALVNPGVPIPADITALTGITDAMVAVAPTISEVLPAFLDFAGSAAMVAHNAEFDVSFLTAACEICGIEWPRRTVIDTAVLSRMLLSSVEVTDHKLGTLSGHFGAQAWPAHRALADARATATVLAALLGRLACGPRPTPGPPVYQPAANTSRVPAVRDTSPSRYDVAAAKARASRYGRRLWSPR